MKISEYKEEVKSLTLSTDFKEKLKNIMLEEYSASHPGMGAKQIKKSSAGLRRYSKYLALAACLLLVVSTVSVVSIAGLRSKFTAESDDSADAETNDAAATYGLDEPAEGGWQLMRETPDETEVEGVDDIAEEPLDDASGVRSAEEEEADEPEDVDVNEDTLQEDYPDETDEVVGDAVPTTGNGFSTGASADYDGSYDGREYVLDGEIGGSALNVAVKVSDSSAEEISLSSTYIIPAGASKTSLTSDDTPVEAPRVDAEYDEEVDDAVDSDELPSYSDNTDADIDKLFDELHYSFSYKYYDVRDGVIADLDEVALVRFEIVDAYDSYELVVNNSSVPVNIDLDKQTLYSINITYDYFNSEEVNVTSQMLNTGNRSFQLYGRPLMEGEYIAVLYKNKDLVLEPIPQLIYAVHKVNGLDIAYHVYSDDGFMVDPGSTNMGLNDEERAVVTSTANNPEIYTQKAAVRELTAYLRRNILRMEPKLINLNTLGMNALPQSSDESASDSGEELTDQETPMDAKAAMLANYPTGSLKYEDGKVNGVAVGDSLEDAVKALYLTDYTFAPNCVLTLSASDEDGGWRVIVTVEGGTVTAIELKP